MRDCVRPKEVCKKCQPQLEKQDGRQGLQSHCGLSDSLITSEMNADDSKDVSLQNQSCALCCLQHGSVAAENLPRTCPSDPRTSNASLRTHLSSEHTSPPNTSLLRTYLSSEHISSPNTSLLRTRLSSEHTSLLRTHLSPRTHLSSEHPTHISPQSQHQITTCFRKCNPTIPSVPSSILSNLLPRHNRGTCLLARRVLKIVFPQPTRNIESHGILIKHCCICVQSSVWKNKAIVGVHRWSPVS